jgi:hypothetical protein
MMFSFNATDYESAKRSFSVPAPEYFNFAFDVKAFIVLAPGYKPSDKSSSEIQEFVKARIASYKYPREIEFMNELPKTVSGKVKRDAGAGAEAGKGRVGREGLDTNSPRQTNRTWSNGVDTNEHELKTLPR